MGFTLKTYRQPLQALPLPSADTRSFFFLRHSDSYPSTLQCHRDPLLMRHCERSEACLPAGRRSLFFPVLFKDYFGLPIVIVPIAIGILVMTLVVFRKDTSKFILQRPLSFNFVFTNLLSKFTHNNE